MAPLPFNDPLLAENGWRPPPPFGFPNYTHLANAEPSAFPHWWRAVAYLDVAFVGSIADARVVARFVDVLVVGVLAFGCRSRLFSRPGQGWDRYLCWGSGSCSFLLCSWSHSRWPP